MSYSTQDGRSISAALNYQVPVAIDNGTSWKVPNADGTFGKAAVLQLCKDAYVVYQDVKYLDDARQIQGNKSLSWNPSKLWSPYGSYDNIKSLRSSAMRGLEVVGGRTAGIIWPVSRMFLIMVLTTIVNM